MSADVRGWLDDIIALASPEATFDPQTGALLGCHQSKAHEGMVDMETGNCLGCKIILKAHKVLNELNPPSTGRIFDVARGKEIIDIPSQRFPGGLIDETGSGLDQAGA